MSGKTQPKRRYDAELKSTVLSACVAAVASAYGLKADVVHKGRYQIRKQLSLAPSVERSARATDFEFTAL